MLIQAILTLAVAMALSIFGAYFKDADHFSSFILQLWFFASPTLYTMDQVPDVYRQVLSFNPLVGLWSGYRSILMKGSAPDGHSLLITFVTSLLLFFMSATIFGRLEKQLAKVI